MSVFLSDNAGYLWHTVVAILVDKTLGLYCESFNGLLGPPGYSITVTYKKYGTGCSLSDQLNISSIKPKYHDIFPVKFLSSRGWVKKSAQTFLSLEAIY